jgi:hypothetical protein
MQFATREPKFLRQFAKQILSSDGAAIVTKDSSPKIDALLILPKPQALRCFNGKTLVRG